MSKATVRSLALFALLALLSAGLSTGAFAQSATPLAPGSIQVSRIQYDGDAGTGNVYTSTYSFPELFNDQAGLTTGNEIQDLAGIQGSIYIDQFGSIPASTVAGSLSLPSTGTPVTSDPVPEPGGYITTSFSSKSEGALMLSVDGNYLTYMGYLAGDQLNEVSNSYSLNPNYQLSPNSYTEDPNLGTPITITSASDTSGGTGTIVVSSPVTVPTGAYFTISGMVSPYTGYNGTWATKSASSGSTTITLTGLPDSLGTCSTVGTSCSGTATYDPPYPFYDREIALINSTGVVSLTPVDNLDSGDNPRAAITVDGNEFYTAGNSDSTTASPSTGPNNPGLTIGSRCAIPENAVSYQLGNYVAADRGDETAKKHVKDNNWRGVGIYTDANGHQQLYVSKGSGSNGDDGLFQVGSTLPSCTLGGTDTTNTITELPGLAYPVTNQTTGAATPILSFGFWFANPTTLYVADEGNPPTYTGGATVSFQNSTNGTYTPANDSYAGLEKWSLVSGTWVLDYTVQAGLNFNVPQTFSGYNDINGDPIASYTAGLRNMAGYNNGDGTVTIYAITAQFSAVSGGEPDPTSLVGITDQISATTMPAGEQFVTLQTSANQEVYRGVAYVPPSPDFSRASQTVDFESVGTQTYPASPITLSATVTSGWPISYAVTSGPATVSGNTLTITGAGSVVVAATQSGNTDYAPATTGQTITVNQGTNTVTFTTPAPASAEYGSSFTVAASGLGTGAITYTSDGVVCTNSGATYTMISGSGTCTVTATQAADQNYQSASASESVTAEPAQGEVSVSLTSGSNPSTYGASITFTATVTSDTGAVKGRKTTKRPRDLNGSVSWSGWATASTDCPTSAVSGNPSAAATCTTSNLPGGTDTVTATYTASDSNHTTGSGSVSQTVNPTANTVRFTTAAPASAVYNSSFTVAASGLGTGAISYTSDGVVCTNSGATYTMISGTGNCTVTATQAADSNYESASASGTTHATKASQTITVTTAAPSSAIDGSSFTIAASASSGLAVSYTSAGSCTNSGATYTITAKSKTGTTCTEDVFQTGNSNYNAAIVVSEQTTVTRATAPMVSFTGPSPAKAPYGTTFQVTASSTDDTSVPVISTSTGSVCQVTGSTTSGTTVTTNVNMLAGSGMCDLTANWAVTAVYSAKTATLKVAAGKAAPTVSFTGAPGTATVSSSFTVTATSNSAPAAYIHAVPAGQCSVGTLSCTGNTCTASVTINKTTAACKMSAHWDATSDYDAISAPTQTTN